MAIFRIISKTWSSFILFVLFALIFYAGIVTGLYLEQRQHTVNDRRMIKMEDKIRDIIGEMEVIKTQQRRK